MVRLPLQGTRCVGAKDKAICAPDWQILPTTAPAPSRARGKLGMAGTAIVRLVRLVKLVKLVLNKRRDPPCSSGLSATNVKQPKPWETRGNRQPLIVRTDMCAEQTGKFWVSFLRAVLEAKLNEGKIDTSMS
jgi:hypothetical protein